MVLWLLGPPVLFLQFCQLLLTGQVGQAQEVLLEELDGREANLLLKRQGRACCRVLLVVHTQGLNLLANIFCKSQIIMMLRKTAWTQSPSFDRAPVAVDVLGDFQQFLAAILGVFQVVRRLPLTGGERKDKKTNIMIND